MSSSASLFGIEAIAALKVTAVIRPMNLIKGEIQRREDGLFFVETADSDPLRLPVRDNVILNTYTSCPR